MDAKLKLDSYFDDWEKECNIIRESDEDEDEASALLDDLGMKALHKAIGKAGGGVNSAASARIFHEELEVQFLMAEEEATNAGLIKSKKADCLLSDEVNGFLAYLDDILRELQLLCDENGDFTEDQKVAITAVLKSVWAVDSNLKGTGSDSIGSVAAECMQPVVDLRDQRVAAYTRVAKSKRVKVDTHRNKLYEETQQFRKDLGLSCKMNETAHSIAKAIIGKSDGSASFFEIMKSEFRRMAAEKRVAKVVE